MEHAANDLLNRLDALYTSVIALAEEKVQGEDEVRTRVEAGMPAREAFERFGVL